MGLRKEKGQRGRGEGRRVQPRDSSLSAELVEGRTVSVALGREQGSTAVRIENLQRPLTEKTLAEWLSSATGVEVRADQLWLNGIKSVCVVSFADAAQASRSRALVHGRRFPNGNELRASLSSVGAEEARVAAVNPSLAKAKPVAPPINAPPAPPSSESPRAGAGRRVALGGPVDLFRLALSTALRPPIVEIPASLRGVETGFVTRRFKGGGAGDDSIGGGRARLASEGKRKAHREEDSWQEAHERGIKSLDARFNKTSAEPRLYWLPVGEQEVERRRLLITDADA